MTDPQQHENGGAEKLLSTGVSETAAEAREDSADSMTSQPMTWLVRVVAFLPLVMCFLGTGRSSWALGLMAVTVGVLVLLYPPQVKMPYILLTVMAGIAFLTLLPLIPIKVPFPPSWRLRLAEDVGMPLASAWSVQPLVTLENWLFMMVIMVWFAWLVTQERVSEHRSHILRILASGISWLALFSLIFYFKGWHPDSWTSGSARDIGPFANRNHFSCLMAMNAILCLASAYDLLRRRKRQWIYYALGLVPCFAVVLVNTSRAGFALFFGGVVFWFVAASLRKRSLKRLAIGGALLLACTTGTVLFAKQLLAHFSKGDKGVIETLTDDGRFKLYSDTLDLILQHPVLGVGLGNFSGVFGFTNHMKEAYVRFRHPESDLLWFVAEAGWPATLAGLLGVVVFLAWMGPWKSASKGARRRERRLRLAAGLAVMLALGHGLVDTPGRGMPMALTIALLASLALYGNKVSQSRGIMITGLLRVGGGLAVLAGCVWLLTFAGFNTPMGESVWMRDLAKARRASDSEDVATGWAAAQSAVRVAPISWEAYYQRANLGLRMGRSMSEAMADFGRARYLEPNVAIICMNEAEIWLRHQPSSAIPAWREALHREGNETLNRYRAMLSASQKLPELRQQVRSLAFQSKLLLAYLITCTTEPEFSEVMTEMLSRYPDLEGLNHYERGQFFQLWRGRGDRKALVAALESHERWLDDGWLVLAYENAETGRPQKAYELAMAHMSAPVTMSPDMTISPDVLQREFLFNPSDAKRGFTLAVVQREKQRYADALATLEKIASLPNSPKQVHYEMAKVYAKMNNFVKAWESMAKYLQL